MTAAGKDGMGDRMKDGEGINQRIFVHNPGYKQQQGIGLGWGECGAAWG